MTPGDKVAIPEKVIARAVGEDVVILDLASGTYFGLNGAGARAWQLLAQGCTVGEACAVLGTEFEVGAEDLERDILELLHQLESGGLLQRRAA